VESIQSDKGSSKKAISKVLRIRKLVTFYLNVPHAQED